MNHLCNSCRWGWVRLGAFDQIWIQPQNAAKKHKRPRIRNNAATIDFVAIATTP